jgi:transcription antitermination factor NusG
LYFSGKIASMPERQISDLKLLLANEADFELTDRTFKPGESMNITAGPLKGLRGELVSVYSQKRLLIRIEHVGQSMLVQVPAAFLETVEGNKELV